MSSNKFIFAVDRGGTFTDIVARRDDGTVFTRKVLSRSPDYPDAPSEGIRQVLSDVLGAPVARPVPTDSIREIRMGTTVATNALLERKGARVLLLVTRGFGDVLDIGTQARPDLFALDIKKPLPIAERVVEVAERMRLDRTDGRLVATPVLGVDEAALRETLQAAFDDGIRSVAISFVHSFANPAHELVAARLAEAIGFTTISASSQLVPMIKYIPRTTTAVVNAYLSPVVKEYLSTFRQQFAGGCDVPLLFMQSDGGLVPSERFDAFRSVLSGPAGGVTGCGRVGVNAFGEAVPLVGFDMGGTSTDVCRCVKGEVGVASESEVAGTTMQFPQVDVNTVAAGGGSILEWRDGMFTVGPHSAGAQPGPMCYGRGGPLTITDANVMLGRVQPALMPRLFGSDGQSPIDPEPVKQAFADLAKKVSAETGVPCDGYDVALSFIEVANEQMCRPVRTLTEGRGYSCKDHALVSFGGAGGQHACGIARKLGMRRVLIHRHAAVLSAVGIGTAPVVRERIVPWGGVLDAESVGKIAAELDQIAATERGAVPAGAEAVKVRSWLSLRFDGTSTALEIEANDLEFESIRDTFCSRHRTEFGFVLDRPITADSVRLRVTYDERQSFVEPEPLPRRTADAVQEVAVHFAKGGATPTKIVDSLVGEALTVVGPALLRCQGSVIVVEPNVKATVDAAGSVQLELDDRSDRIDDSSDAERADPRALTVYSHRFMSIAEQMGRALQQTAVSTNIKERLDFSCAIFDADAGLVANAPHIPVHLGAMGATVAFQKAKWGAEWHDDDVIVCNHPAHGGSHLPDITVITPVVAPGVGRIGYVASRAHHSDIGGATPGSMPPFSTTLEQEGAIIEGFKLVRGGTFDEAGITELLMAPAAVEGCTGCRTLPDVLSDLHAQIAANNKGVALLRELIEVESHARVATYMRHLQNAAADAVQNLIRERVAAAAAAGKASGPQGTVALRCEDQMDDGSPIVLTVTLNGTDGTATFDFTGTGRQVHGSTNCPTQVVRSAVLYSMRCLLDSASAALPLNEGCMRPLTIQTPAHSLLSPSPTAAIVAGNVLTSQRITDVILYAFGACACAQGDMNNLTFGNSRYSYYETVCGGAGAGPTFNGADAVHTHMTNTRITDVEWLESRFPVLLHTFEVRRGSGGRGKYRGGCGVVRSFIFLEAMTVCMLSERRAVAPRGLNGGCDGAKGVNLVIQGGASTLQEALSISCDDHRAVNIGAKATMQLGALDMFTMLTPGGGGFGAD